MQKEEKAAKTAFGKVGYGTEYGVRRWSKVIHNVDGKSTLELSFMWSKVFPKQMVPLKGMTRDQEFGRGGLQYSCQRQ